MHPDEDDPEAQSIGVYRTKRAATGAVARLADKPGFRGQPDLVTDARAAGGGFQISRYVLDEDDWVEGHVPG